MSKVPHKGLCTEVFSLVHPSHVNNKFEEVDCELQGLKYARMYGFDQFQSQWRCVSLPALIDRVKRLQEQQEQLQRRMDHLEAEKAKTEEEKTEEAIDEMVEEVKATVLAKPKKGRSRVL